MNATVLDELEVTEEEEDDRVRGSVSDHNVAYAGYGDQPQAGTVLLVEDEDFVREVTCEVLRTCGYRVLSASNAREAEGIYRNEGLAIDLLLTDVVLPGETGCDLAKRLQMRNPGLKVLLATGYGEQMAKLTKSQELWLAKPFSREELVQRVRQKMERPALQETESGMPAAAHGLQDLSWNLA